MNHHFNENEEETLVETEKSDKSQQAREKKFILNEGASNINSHSSNSNRENVRNEFDSQTDSVILPIMRNNTDHQYFSKESTVIPDKKSKEHVKESKGNVISKELG